MTEENFESSDNSVCVLPV